MAKRLLFILDQLEFGGVERNTVHIANHLAESGHFVTLLCLTKTGPMERFISSKVKVMVFGVARIRHAFFKLVSYLHGHDFDAVITAKEYNNVVTLAASLLTFKKIKIITSTRTHLISEKENGKSRAFAIALFLARYLYPFAYKRIGVSKGVAQSVKDALDRPDMDVGVIYNPAADSRKFTINPPAPHAWFKGEVPILVTCGRICTAKDYAFLVESFSRLVKTTSARLIIVGDGELREELQAKIDELKLNDSVFINGYAENPEDFMFHARLFVLSSLWEGFGNVIVEALAVGCPVLSTDCPSGPHEILEDGKWGRLVKERDPDIFAKAMAEEIAKERPERSFLQKRASDFTPEKIAADYLALLD